MIWVALFIGFSERATAEKLLLLRLHDLDTIPIWEENTIYPDSVRLSPGVENREGSVEMQGSKSLRVVVGNEGVLLEQDLQLQLRGPVAPNVEVDAKLSDHGNPRNQGGVTSSLAEMDEVYMRFFGEWGFLHLGDFRHRLDSMNLWREEFYLRGVHANWKSNRGHVGGAWGNWHAETKTAVFAGRDGQRRGYHVGGENAFAGPVVAGSVRVWFNGTPLRPGEDFKVDEFGSTLDFVGAILPSFRDEIRVEYQVFDANLARQVFSSDGGAANGNWFIRWAAFLQDSDLESLRRNWWSDAEWEVLRTDSGGALVRWAEVVDSLVPSMQNGLLPRVLYAKNNQGRWEAFDSEAGLEQTLYRVDFAWVGNGAGSYIRQDTTLVTRGIPMRYPVFRYSGEGAGNYLPGQKLRRPSSLRRLGTIVGGKLGKDGPNLQLEMAWSGLDSNSASQTVAREDGLAAKWNLFGDKATNSHLLFWSMPGMWREASWKWKDGAAESWLWSRLWLLDREMHDSSFVLQELHGHWMLGSPAWHALGGGGLLYSEPAATRSLRTWAELRHRQNSIKSSVEAGFTKSELVEQMRWGFWSRATSENHGGFWRPQARLESRLVWQGDSIGLVQSSYKQLSSISLFRGPPVSFSWEASSIVETELDRVQTAEIPWKDSLQTIAYTERFRYQLSKVRAEGDVLGQLRWRRLGSGDGGDLQNAKSWLLEKNSRWGAEVQNGDFAYSMGLTQQRPLLPLYRPVVPGTGDVTYDPILGEFVEGVDRGDFVREGWVPQDSVAWRQDREVALQLRQSLRPGQFLGIRQGFLKDLFLQVAMTSNGRDSTQVQNWRNTLPPWSAEKLQEWDEGRVFHEVRMRWENNQWRSWMQWERRNDWEKFGGRKTGTRNMRGDYGEMGKILWLKWTLRGNVGLEQMQRQWEDVLQWRAELLGGEVAIPVIQDVEILPGIRGRWAKGSSPWEAMQGNLMQYHLGVRWVYQNRGRLDAQWSSTRASQQKSTYVPYEFLEGFAPGLTNRLQVQAMWDAGAASQMRLSYLLRKDPGLEPITHKISGEVRAFF